MEETKKIFRPWYLYALSTIPFIAGLVVCLLLTVKVWKGVVAFNNSLVRVVVPGDTTVVLPKSGDYTIFHEMKSVVGGVVYSAPENVISGMSCTLTDIRTGNDVPLRVSSANMNYSLGSREGKSLLDFNIAEGGSFRLRCGFQDGGHGGAKVVLAMGQGFGKEIFNMISFIFGIVLIFLVSAAATTGAIVYLLVKKPK